MRVLIIVSLLLVPTCDAGASRRAVLVGIDDYGASGWPNLAGAVNDVHAMEEMLVLLYDFNAQDIVTLTNRQATRAGILRALEHLAKSAAKDDVLLFYFAGHGSQRRNSLSDEPDQLDETLVPADSRAGAGDIRDKELRPIFNRILDHGARLTVILDNCHSGSGARGLPTGARPRGIDPDLRDIADRTNYGPRPEERGALVLSATQDTESAWETMDEEKKMHGAFSWAWIRAMRDSSPDESAAETFARAAARMRAERPYQEPVIAGTADVMHAPFLGTRKDRRERTAIAVEKVLSDGTVVVQGGWAHGLAIGTEIRVVGDHTATLRITRLLGMGRSEGRGSSTAPSMRSGALMEIVSWAAPAGRPLRVWMPRSSGNELAIARKLRKEASRHGFRWIKNPIETTPSHVLRSGTRQWELLDVRGNIQLVEPLSAIAKLPPSASLFVQFSAPASWLDDLDIDGKSIVVADRAEDADYMLTGRYESSRLEYAWLRPLTKFSDRPKCGLPLQTAWTAEPSALREGLLRLRKIHAWHVLESPRFAQFPYRLGVRRVRDGKWASDVVIGGEAYALYLRAPKLPVNVAQRHIYVFVIDSHGDSSILFGTSSVENRFPRPGDPSKDIALGPTATFRIVPPYGTDTYFLLATDEPLTNPRILEWDGVRSRRPAMPSTWSIERLYLESRP